MTEVLARATLREKAQVTFPAEVRDALHIEPGDDIEFRVDVVTGVVTVTGLKVIPAEQAWFWTEEWQRREAEAAADYAEGRTDLFESGEDFLASLDD
jgi:AbrB family looped-hinge helix DNA binding protein